MELKIIFIKENEKINLNESFKNIDFYKFNKKLERLDLLICLSDDKKKMKKYIKKLIKNRKKLSKNYNELNIYLLNYNEKNSIYKQFKELLEPICSNNIYNVYDKAYDLACDYLDSYFYGKNLCEFKNNRCGYRPNLDINCGCCRHWKKHKHFGFLLGEKLEPCEYLGSDNHCTIKCLRCKLFSCDYLVKKGINFKTKDIFCLYSVFNLVQRLILNTFAYTDKSDVLKIVKYL